jgi:predicted RecA/RadA family phage recombinase
MNIFRSPGKVMTFIAPAGGVQSNQVVLIGALVVVATTSAAAAQPFAGMSEGVFGPAPKAAGQAWAEGALLYWDSTANNFTTTVGASTRRAGCAAAAALAADTTGQVRLHGVPAPPNVA